MSLTTLTSKQYAGRMLDRLVDLDQEVTGAFYEMGQILSSLEHGKLWDLLGYESFTHLVNEEMSFTSGTAGKYLHTYRHFKRLGYNKTDSLDLIRSFSFTRVAEWAAKAPQKVGKRAVGNAIKRNLENRRQINFSVNAEEYARVQRALRKHGAVRTETGRWENSSEAFLDIINGDGNKPLLKAVG